MGTKKDQHKAGTPAKPRGQQTGFAGNPDQNREAKADTPALRGRRQRANKMFSDASRYEEAVAVHEELLKARKQRVGLVVSDRMDYVAMDSEMLDITIASLDEPDEVRPITIETGLLRARPDAEHRVRLMRLALKKIGAPEAEPITA